MNQITKAVLKKQQRKLYSIWAMVALAPAFCLAQADLARADASFSVGKGVQVAPRTQAPAPVDQGVSAAKTAPASEPAVGPGTSAVQTPNTSNAPGAPEYNTYYTNMGGRLGDNGTAEGFVDMLLPLVNSERNFLFFSPRLSLADEGQNDFSLGLGLRRMMNEEHSWALGVNGFVDYYETEHDNRFHKYGAGLELLTEYIDVRGNYYWADSDREKIGEYNEIWRDTSSVTTASTRKLGTSTRKENIQAGSGVSDAHYYADDNQDYKTYGNNGTFTNGQKITGHEVGYSANIANYEKTTTTTRYRTTYTTRTTITDTTRWYEKYEEGMDGWDAEAGFKIPWDNGPEMRVFGGYYDYDNPFGDDIDGWKARLEIRTGPYLALDGELFEDDKLNGSDWFLGFRLQVPLSREFSWKDFADGLYSGRHRTLDERVRGGEMVMRDPHVHTAESDWMENERCRHVETATRVDTRNVNRTSTSTRLAQIGEATAGEVLLYKDINFVAKDAPTANQDGSYSHPYTDDGSATNGNAIQYAIDNGPNGKTGGHTVLVQQGGVFNYPVSSKSMQVEIKNGVSVTSEILFSGHPRADYGNVADRNSHGYYTSTNPDGTIDAAGELPTITGSVKTKSANSNPSGLDTNGLVTMHPGSTLHRMNVQAVTGANNPFSAVKVEGNGETGDIYITNSTLSTDGPSQGAHALHIQADKDGGLANSTVFVASVKDNAAAIGVKDESDYYNPNPLTSVYQHLGAENSGSPVKISYAESKSTLTTGTTPETTEDAVSFGVYMDVLGDMKGFVADGNDITTYAQGSIGMMVDIAGDKVKIGDLQIVNNKIERNAKKYEEGGFDFFMKEVLNQADPNDAINPNGIVINARRGGASATIDGYAIRSNIVNFNDATNEKDGRGSAILITDGDMKRSVVQSGGLVDWVKGWSIKVNKSPEFIIPDLASTAKDYEDVSPASKIIGKDNPDAKGIDNKEGKAGRIGAYAGSDGVGLYFKP